jgi:hypothetical protein
MKGIPFSSEFAHRARDLRDVLIDHLDGAEVDWMTAPNKSRRRRALVMLLRAKLIRLRSRYGAAADQRTTTITDFGREALSVLLADYADALTRVALIRDGSIDSAKERRAAAEDGESFRAALIGDPCS